MNHPHIPRPHPRIRPSSPAPSSANRDHHPMTSAGCIGLAICLVVSGVIVVAGIAWVMRAVWG